MVLVFLGLEKVPAVRYIVKQQGWRAQVSVISLHFTGVLLGTAACRLFMNDIKHP